MYECIGYVAFYLLCASIAFSIMLAASAFEDPDLGTDTVWGCLLLAAVWPFGLTFFILVYALAGCIRWQRRRRDRAIRAKGALIREMFNQGRG